MSIQQFTKDDLTSVNASNDTSIQADSKLQAIKDVLGSGSSSSQSNPYSRYLSGSRSSFNTNGIDKKLISGLPLADKYRNGSNGRAYADATDGEKAVLWALETKARVAAGVVAYDWNSPQALLNLQQSKLNQGTWDPSKDGYYVDTPNGLVYDPTGETKAKLDAVKNTGGWEWLRDNGYDYTEGGLMYGKPVSGPKGGYNRGITDDPAQKGDYQKALEAVYSGINPHYIQIPASTTTLDERNLATANKILAQAGVDDNEQRTLIDSFIKIEKGESLTPSLLAPDKPAVAGTTPNTTTNEDKPLASEASSSSSTKQFTKDDLTSVNASNDTSIQADSKLQAIKDVLGSGSSSSQSNPYSRYLSGSRSSFNTNGIDKKLISGLPLADKYRNGSNGRAYADATDGEKAVLWALETKARAAAGVPTHSQSSALTPTQRISMQNNMMATGTWKPSDGYYFFGTDGLAYDPTGMMANNRITNPENYMLDPRAPGETGPYGIPDKDGYVRIPEKDKSNWQWQRDNGYDYREGGAVNGAMVTGPKGAYNTGWTDDPALKSDAQKNAEAAYAKAGVITVPQPQATQINPDLAKADKILAQAGIDDNEQRTLIDSFIKIEKGESLTPSLLAPDKPAVAGTGQGATVEEVKPVGSDVSSSSDPQQTKKNYTSFSLNSSKNGVNNEILATPVATSAQPAQPKPEQPFNAGVDHSGRLVGGTIDHYDDVSHVVAQKHLAIKDALGDTGDSRRRDRLSGSSKKDSASNIDRYSPILNPTRDDKYSNWTAEQREVLWAITKKADAIQSGITQADRDRASAAIPRSISVASSIVDKKLGNEIIANQGQKAIKGEWDPSRDGFYYWEGSNPNGENGVLRFDPTGKAADFYVGHTGQVNSVKNMQGRNPNDGGIDHNDWLKQNGYNHQNLEGSIINGPKGEFNKTEQYWQRDQTGKVVSAGVAYKNIFGEDAYASATKEAKDGFYYKNATQSAGKSLWVKDLDKADEILANAGLDNDEQQALINKILIADGQQPMASSGVNNETLATPVATSAQSTAEEVASLVNATPNSSKPTSYGSSSKDNSSVPFMRDDTAVQAEYKAQAIREAVGNSPINLDLDKNFSRKLDETAGRNSSWSSRRFSDQEKAVAWALETVAKPPVEQKRYTSLGVNVSQSLMAKMNLQNSTIANGEWKPSDGYYFKTPDGDIAFDPTGMAANNRFTNPENYMSDPRAPGQDGPYGIPDRQGYVRIPEKTQGSWQWKRDNGYSYTEGGSIDGERISGPKGEYLTGTTNDTALKSDGQLAREARMEAVMATPGVKIVQRADASNMAQGLTLPKSDLETAKLILAQAGLDENEQKALTAKFLSIENGGSSPSLLAPDKPAVAVTVQSTSQEDSLLADSTANTNSRSGGGEFIDSIRPVVSSGVSVADQDSDGDATTQGNSEDHRQDEEAHARATAAKAEADEKQSAAHALASGNKASAKENRLKKIMAMRKPWSSGAASASNGTDSMVAPVITPSSQVPPPPL